MKKLVFLTAADIIDQKNQLRELAQCQKYSKTADEVGENIHLEKFQPYEGKHAFFVQFKKKKEVLLGGGGD